DPPGAAPARWHRQVHHGERRRVLAGRHRSVIARETEGSSQDIEIRRGEPRMRRLLKGVAVAAMLSAAPGAMPLPAPATSIESVHATHEGKRTTVTLRADGQLTPASVEETVLPPRRLVLDFEGVGSRTAPETAVKSPLVSSVSVTVNSRKPLVTRVVLEVVDGSTYHIERGDDPEHDLSIVFEPAQSP